MRKVILALAMTLVGFIEGIKTFVHSGLIDIYRISVHPIALAKGKLLFDNLKDPQPLRLIKTNVFKSGVV